MTLKIYNTQTRRLEPFVTLSPGRVTMYCCGVTVYDYYHLGHARSYIIWDMVRRYLQWRGYKVTYVQNFTDIKEEDSITTHFSTLTSKLKKLSIVAE